MKVFKDFMPFAIYYAVELCASGVNSKFKPYLVWTSLELSRATLRAVEPLAPIYEKALTSVGKFWDQYVEHRVVDFLVNFFYKKR